MITLSIYQAIYLVSAFILSIVFMIIFMYYALHHLKSENRKLTKKLKEVEMVNDYNRRQTPLIPFDETIKIIDNVIDDVWKNKYFLYYRLKEIRIIANMDDEVSSLAKEIITSFSKEFMETVSMYFTDEYFAQMITRRAQMLIVDYTNTYKPSTK